MSSTDSWIASKEQESFDAAMATHDCWGSQAHVLMLRKTGIINDQDAAAALRAIVEIEDEIARDGFVYRPGLGSQLTLEAMIIDKVGEAIGLQVHTGRSRNDQVLVAQKLYVRDNLLELLRSTVRLIELLIRRADEGTQIVMPGYTHMQPARPTTVGQWFAMHADACMRDVERLRDALVRHDSCPLGAADSYGTSWPLDREYTAQLLAFDRVDEIPIEAISSRGESDTDFLSGMSFLATHLSRAAQDLLLFTTFEYGYATLTEKVAERMGKLTGSSIMPQKKNPDVLELLRAQVSEIHSYLFHCLELAKALPMGYNRDTRDTKGPIIRGIAALRQSVDQAINAIEGVEFDEDRMLSAVNENYCMATDLAEYIAQRCSIPFRIVHRIVGRTVKDAVASGVKLYEVELATFQEQAKVEGYEIDLTAEELSNAIDPTAAVQRRQCVGGPSKSTMQSWVESRTARLDELTTWIEGRVAHIAAQRSAVRAEAHR